MENIENTINLLLLEKVEEVKKLLLEKPLYPKWLSITKASEYCSLSPSTINRLIRQSKLKASKVTGKTLIKLDWLEQYLRG